MIIKTKEELKKAIADKEESFEVVGELAEQLKSTQKIFKSTRKIACLTAALALAAPVLSVVAPVACATATASVPTVVIAAAIVTIGAVTIVALRRDYDVEFELDVNGITKAKYKLRNSRDNTADA